MNNLFLSVYIKYNKILSHKNLLDLIVHQELGTVLIISLGSDFEAVSIELFKYPKCSPVSLLIFC